MSFRRLLWVFSFVLLFSLSPALSQEDLGFHPLWCGESADIELLDVQSALEEIRGEEPDHIVILVHGFGTSREASLRQYQTVTERLRRQFEAHNLKVSVVGLQWDSQVKFSLFSIADKYFEKSHLARRTGHLGMRKLLFELERKFPKKPYHILGHSMGCELTTAALVPTLVFDEKLGTEGVVFEKDQIFDPVGTVFCGSDLDYDVAVKEGADADIDFRSPRGHRSLLWMTQSDFFGRRKDRILDLRAKIRGKAWGSTFPKMTEKGYDDCFNAQYMVFDDHDIPRNHKLTNYYDDKRLERIVAALLHYTHGDKYEAPMEVKMIEKVMESPNSEEALSEFLHGDSLSGGIYAIWRLEHLLCGSSGHLADGHLPQLVNALRRAPRKVRYRMKNDICQSVRRGHFPSGEMLERVGAPSWARK